MPVPVTSAMLLGILESAMDAIITIDERQQIVLFNAAAETIFRCPAQEAIGRSIDRFVPQRFREMHREHVHRFGEAGATMRRMGGELVLSGLRADGEEFPIEASISQARVEGRKLYTVILRDVSERHRAAAELANSTQRLLGILDSAMDAIITVDESQRIVLFNAAAETIFNCPAKEAIGSSLDRFIPERFRAAHRHHVQRFGEAGATMRRMGGELILSGLRASGEEFPIEASISQTRVAGKRLYTVILRDVSERQRAAQELQASHQRLRALYEQMHEVREGERTRIARELHDELAQWLTALKMDAAAVSSRLAEDDPLRQRVERMKKVVDTTVASVRRIAADLRPVMLDDLGIVAAIENLLLDFAERTGLAVDLQHRTGEAELQEPHATALYRMVQEALTNVARHAAAKHVWVRVSAADGQIRVTVRDDGRGIPPDALGAKGSFGVLGIHERARTLGGEAHIYAAPEGGTVVDIVVPLEKTAVGGQSS